MNNIIIHKFSAPEDVARAMADFIYQKVLLKTVDIEKFNIAVSGGSTPKVLFQILGTEYGDKIPWEKFRIFWVDERCVPPTHEESNYKMTLDNLLYKVNIPKENIFRMKGESDPQAEAERYQQLLEFQLPDVDGFPVFDLILLGMGDDGHTASIFPDNMSLLQSDKIVAVGQHPSSGQNRITLTGNAINSAKQVAFLITGESKADLIKQIISKDASATKYPAAHVHAANGNIEFYLDFAAAKNI